MAEADEEYGCPPTAFVAGQPIDIELMTLIDNGRSANRPDLSVTRTVNRKVPVVAGCPLIEPELERVSPPGRVPEERDHE